MQTAADGPEAPTAIRTDLGAIFVSLELGRSTWLITALSPRGGEKMSKHVRRGSDVARLLERFAHASPSFDPQFLHELLCRVGNAAGSVLLAMFPHPHINSSRVCFDLHPIGRRGVCRAYIAG